MISLGTQGRQHQELFSLRKLSLGALKKDRAVINHTCHQRSVLTIHRDSEANAMASGLLLKFRVRRVSEVSLHHWLRLNGGSIMTCVLCAGLIRYNLNLADDSILEYYLGLLLILGYKSTVLETLTNSCFAGYLSMLQVSLLSPFQECYSKYQSRSKCRVYVEGRVMVFEVL